ncbi:MAG: hypothetical protein SO147_03200 [Clostridia bacterium]|nr:hypothetical protein [Clostridia bacterium]
MGIYLLAEPSYQSSPWYDSISKSLIREAKQKRIFVDNYHQKHQYSETDLILLIGSTPFWITSAINRLRREHKALLLLISPLLCDLPVSSVVPDTYSSMQEVLAYFNHWGRCRTALYGINPSSAMDLSKEAAFGQPGHVFYNHADSIACFRNFFEKAEQYDSVICANDSIAFSLIRQLEQYQPGFFRRFFIISFHKGCLSSFVKPTLTSVQCHYDEYGKAAMAIYFQLLKNPMISGITIRIKGSLIPGETTEFLPVPETVTSFPVSQEDSCDFYQDQALTPWLCLEKLLCLWDETDQLILKLLLQKESYETIAAQSFLSVNGVKYRLKRLMEHCGIENRKALEYYLTEYLHWPQ